MFGLINKRDFGNQFEDFAVKQLKIYGCIIIEQNFNCKLGEIDIVLKDNSVLVFVEVRYRKQNTFGGARASVDIKKQKKIIKAASYYLQKNNIYDKYTCRFDVFAIQGKPESFECDWIKNAFSA